MLENIGGGEILVILIIVFIFFGPQKLPEIGKYLGKGISSFRNAMNDVKSNLNIDENLTDIKKNFDVYENLNKLKDDLDITKGIKEELNKKIF
jgi:sec-independent protein translocase protein TatA